MKSIILPRHLLKPIIDGTRTQMRVPIHGVPRKFRTGDVAAVTNNSKDFWAISKCDMMRQSGVFPVGTKRGLEPKYKIGDKLCVKESYRITQWDESGNVTIEYAVDGTSRYVRCLTNDYDIFVERQCRLFEKLGGTLVTTNEDGDEVPALGWDEGERIVLPKGVQPPLVTAPCMPKWASRYTLEITGLDCHQVQNISELDAMAEGMEWYGPDDDDIASNVWHAPGVNNFHYGHSAKGAFRNFWEQNHSWVDNDWVFAYTFKLTRNT